MARWKREEKFSAISVVVSAIALLGSYPVRTAKSSLRLRVAPDP